MWRLPALVVFLYRLPRLRVPLSENPSGAFIEEHLALTRLGVPRFRIAQGVLQIPHESSTYLRGRRRQAVRTNNRRALESGISCACVTVAGWAPSDRATDSSTEAERWTASDSRGATVAEAWLVVDDDCALLYSLTSNTSNARWMLHTAIVERLALADCPLLLTNSFDVPLLTDGQQHFQHLLGYTIARIRTTPQAPGVHQNARRTVGAVSALSLFALVIGAVSPSTFGI